MVTYHRHSHNSQRQNQSCSKVIRQDNAIIIRIHTHIIECARTYDNTKFVKNTQGNKLSNQNKKQKITREHQSRLEKMLKEKKHKITYF